MTGRELADCFLGLLSARDFSSLKPLFSEDVRFDYPEIGVVAGRGKVILLLKKITSRFEVLRFQPLDFIGDEHKLCVVWRNEGRLKAGDVFRNEGITLLHLSGGRIDYVSDYFKCDRAERSS